MKIEKIKFDDSHYWASLFLLFTLGIFLLIIFSDALPFVVYVALMILFSFFLSGFFVSLKLGITIDYRRRELRYFGHQKINQPIIKFDDIRKITFEEIPKQRKGSELIKARNFYANAFVHEPEYVYGCGKIYKFVIELNDNQYIEIPYNYLFNAHSKKRVERQERKITDAIDRLNSFL